MICPGGTPRLVRYASALSRRVIWLLWRCVPASVAFSSAQALGRIRGRPEAWTADGY